MRSRILVVAAVAAAITGSSLSGCSSGHPTTASPLATSSATSSPSRTGTPRPTASATASQHGTASASRPTEAQLIAAVRRAVANRPGTFSVAVSAPSAGIRTTIGPDQPVYGASVLKLMILAARRQAAPMNPRAVALARSMITRSDNAAATTLWHVAGENAAMTRIAADADMAATTQAPVVFAADPWDGWRTTASDQLALLEYLVAHDDRSPSSPLTLMRQVVDGQDWGVGSAGAPGADVAVKNGWLPLGATWVVNSDGCIDAELPSRVCIAITSQGSPTEAIGEATATKVARAVMHTIDGSRPQPS